MKSVADQLDPKFAYLLSAPEKDRAGNKAVIRYSRKAKTQYVMSEDEEGKSTGWMANYDGSKWVEKLPALKKAPAKKKAAAKKSAAKKTTAKKAAAKKSSAKKSTAKKAAKK